MVKITQISVIIPVFNEKKNIKNILDAVISWQQDKEVIVIDDGSEDATVALLKPYKKLIKVFTHTQNYGKGAALVTGIQQSSGNLILCLDADVVGIKPTDLDELIAPLMQGKADMVIGVHGFLRIGKIRPYDSISGQRVFWKKDIVNQLQVLKKSRWGAELVINSFFKRKRIEYIYQDHVSTLRKIDKWPFWFAQKNYFKQIWEMLNTFLSIRLKGNNTS